MATRATGYRALAVGLAACAAFALSSCSRSSTPGSTELPECRVGVVMPTTGEMAPYGAEGVIAARLALEQARSIAKQSRPALLEQDSASRVDQANSAAAALLAPPNSVQVIVGEINSDDTAAMIGPARGVGVPIVAPTASRISLTSMSDRIFRIWPSDAYEASKMSEHLVANGVKRVAVLYIQVQYGEEMAKSFEAAFRAAGGDARVESYRRETLDFKPLLRRIEAFDVVYLISYVEDAALLLKHAYEMKRPIKFFGTTVLDSENLIEKAGRAAGGITFAVVQPAVGGDQSRRSDFSARYRKARESADRALASAATEPTFAGLHVYDATSLALAACEAAAAKGVPSGAEVMSYLRAMPPYVGVTGDIRFDTKGDLASDRSVVFKQIVNGKIISLTPQ